MFTTIAAAVAVVVVRAMLAGHQHHRFTLGNGQADRDRPRRAVALDREKEFAMKP